MRKLLFTSISTIILLTATFRISYGQTTTHATETKKTSYADYLDILAKVPELFKNWLNATESIADMQDKKKFAGIGRKISAELTALQKIKITLKANIDSGNIPTEGVWNYNINQIRGHIDQINWLLKQTRSLTDKYSIDNAGTVINAFDIEFTGKVILFNDIVAKSKKPGQAGAVSVDLKKAIDILKAAQKHLDAFVAKLDPPPAHN